MEKLTITIETGNEAFAEYPATELGRILRDAAERIEQGDVDGFPLRDINGRH